MGRYLVLGRGKSGEAAAALLRERGDEVVFSEGWDGVVASPGIPGGVVLASATIAESALGFTPERYALVIATYMALDGMGTACNLTGDGAIALIMDKIQQRNIKGTMQQ
jgi:hypothetical protein